MGRIVALDYGAKRTGIAVTDPDKRIATPLQAVSTHALLPFLQQYVSTEDVEIIVLGYPTRLDQRETHNTEPVKQLEEKLKKEFSNIQIDFTDERFTSKMAVDAMISGGMKKKDRRKKENVDMISAVIILQEYMKENGLW